MTSRPFSFPVSLTPMRNRPTVGGAGGARRWGCWSSCLEITRGVLFAFPAAVPAGGFCCPCQGCQLPGFPARMLPLAAYPEQRSSRVPPSVCPGPPPGRLWALLTCCKWQSFALFSGAFDVPKSSYVPHRGGITVFSLFCV